MHCLTVHSFAQDIQPSAVYWTFAVGQQWGNSGTSDAKKENIPNEQRTNRTPQGICGHRSGSALWANVSIRETSSLRSYDRGCN